MFEGYTHEQAPEKIYQDLIDKGDLTGAKNMRDCQDKVHSVKSGVQPMAFPSVQAIPLKKDLFKNHSGSQSSVYFGFFRLCRFLFGADRNFAFFLLALQTNSL
jgi:hypothetical protein